MTDNARSKAGKAAWAKKSPAEKRRIIERLKALRKKASKPQNKPSRPALKEKKVKHMAKKKAVPVASAIGLGMTGASLAFTSADPAAANPFDQVVKYHSPQGAVKVLGKNAKVLSNYTPAIVGLGISAFAPKRMKNAVRSVTGGKLTL